MKRLALGMAFVLMVGAAVWANGPEDKKANNLSTRTYPVGDLVLSPKQQAEQPGKQAENNGVTPLELRTDFSSLVELLSSSVATDTWTKDDGKDGRVGTMTPFFMKHALIIRTTPEVHDQIGTRLRQLRRLPALRGAVDEVEERRSNP